MPLFEKHVFVCTNRRPQKPGSCCASKQGLEVRQAFVERLKAKAPEVKVRANKSGCLGFCEFGVAVVIYPQQIWYANVGVEDVDEIIEKSILNDQTLRAIKVETTRIRNRGVMSYKDIPDEIVFKKYCQGDAPAFDEILKRHKGLIYHMILRYPELREQADEIFQEVFLKVCKNKDLFSRGGVV